MNASIVMLLSYAAVTALSLGCVSTEPPTLITGGAGGTGGTDETGGTGGTGGTGATGGTGGMEPKNECTWSDSFDALPYAASVAMDPSGNIVIAGTFGGGIGFDGEACNGFLSAGLDDAFVAKIDPSGTCLWIRHIGGPAEDRARAVAVDPSGNVAVTGSCSWDIDIAGSTHPCGLDFAGSGTFVALFDAGGNTTWATTIRSETTNDNDVCRPGPITIDSLGRIWTAPTCVFEGQEIVNVGCAGTLNLVPFTNNLIMRFDPSAPPPPDGSCVEVWLNGNDGVNAIAMNGDNPVLAESDGEVKEMDPVAWFIWSGGGGPAGGGYVGNSAVAIGKTDTEVNVFVTGGFDGTMSWGDFCDSATNTQDGYPAVYVAMIDALAAGECRWVKAYGQGNGAGTGVAADPDGGVIVTGYFSGLLDFGCDTGPLTSNGGEDIFLAKLDKTGACVWIRGLGNKADQQAIGLATDGGCNAALLGGFESAAGAQGAALDVGCGSMSGGFESAFVAKMDLCAFPQE